MMGIACSDADSQRSRRGSNTRNAVDDRVHAYSAMTGRVATGLATPTALRRATGSWWRKDSDWQRPGQRALSAPNTQRARSWVDESIVCDNRVWRV